MIELMFMYVFLPGLFWFLTVALVVGTVLYYVARIIYSIWEATPLAQRWEREEKEARLQYLREQGMREAAATRKREKEETRRKQDADRVRKGLAVEFNGEVCTLKRVGGKQWIRVRGQWMPYA